MTVDHAPRWKLRLYVNGASLLSVAAIDNIRRVCSEELAGDADLEVIDVRDRPALLVEDNVIAAPMLVKELPPPLRHLVGDLSDADRVRAALDIEPPHAKE